MLRKFLSNLLLKILFLKSKCFVCLWRTHRSRGLRELGRRGRQAAWGLCRVPPSSADIFIFLLFGVEDKGRRHSLLTERIKSIFYALSLMKKCLGLLCITLQNENSFITCVIIFQKYLRLTEKIRAIFVARRFVRSRS